MADSGKSAAFVVTATGAGAARTLTVTGHGDDPFLNLALEVGADLALGASPTLALAVEILASYAGKSAARVV